MPEPLNDKRHAKQVAYLAGPMRGIPEYNFPAFYAAAAVLRNHGLDVWSPAENDVNQDGFDPAKDTAQPMRHYMRRDLPAVLDADMVCVLPGWEKSQGAQLEVHVARACGIPVYNAHDLSPASAPSHALPIYGPQAGDKEWKETLPSTTRRITPSCESCGYTESHDPNCPRPPRTRADLADAIEQTVKGTQFEPEFSDAEYLEIAKALRSASSAIATFTPPGVLPRYAAPFKMMGDKTEWVQVRFVPRDAIKDKPTEANPSPIRIIVVGDLERAQPQAIAFNSPDGTAKP